MVYFFIFCALAPQGMYSIIFGRERGGDRRSWLILSFWYQNTEKRNNALSQMRLRSVFKMRMSILNTATTEQMECIIVSFFVYHTNQELIKCFSSRLSIPYSNAAIRQSSTIESITQSILKTCEP